jgi:hypothetical protein
VKKTRRSINIRTRSTGVCVTGARRRGLLCW